MAIGEHMDVEQTSMRAAARKSLPLLLVVLLIGSLGALLYSASQATRDHQHALAEQQRSFEIIALARGFEARTARAEVTLARYVISLDPDTGRLFQDQWRGAASQLKALAYAARQSDWQRGNVEALQYAFEQRGKTLTEIGLRTTYAQKMTALARFHQAGKSQDLRRITALLDIVIRAENTRLQERSLAVTRAGDRTESVGRTSRLLGLVLLVCVLFAAWFANVAINERMKARSQADAEGERADRLDAAVRARTAELSDAYERLQQESAERATAEDNLRQLQKMEAVGQLTGGIAHDFNNLLQIVTGNLDLMLRSLPPEDVRMRRMATNAAAGATRAATLTQRLLAFSRRQPLAPRATDPNQLIDSLSVLLHRTLNETIEIVTLESPDVWPIEIDVNQMENALLNLAVNARDAMPDGGQLTIEVANVEVDDRLARHEGDIKAGHYVMIGVTDTGTGMDAATLAQAIEPFFTTKEVGRGTGLGLSMVYGFIRQSGGYMRVYSEAGIGSCIKLYLPRHMGDLPRPDIVEDMPAPVGDGGSETILLCEDDENVRAFSVEVLSELGYRVIAAADAQQALEQLQAADGDISLLFTDVVLPGGMNGADLAREVQQMRPDLPILFTTGYARNAIVHHGRLDEGVELLTKPFSYGDLAAKVREMLDRTPQIA